MKKITLLSLFMGLAIAYGQVTAPTFNKWSIDLALGTNKAVKPFTPGYYSGITGIGSLRVGARYMFNATVGFDLSLGHDRFVNAKNSLPYTTNLSRLNMQAVFNIANAFNFYEWTQRIGLFAHTGVGFGSAAGKDAPRPRELAGHLMLGLTPQIKLTNKLAVNLDLTVVGTAHKGSTWDFQSAKSTFDGVSQTFWTFTGGISYYLGKYDQHADWSPTKGVKTEDMEMMRAEMEKMRKGMKDDDADGVPNYLDKEPSTPAGNAVDMQGVTDPNRMDTDRDGIADSFDDCPEEEGKFATNGCPDMDADGIADKNDKCPNKAGVASNNGCPASGGNTPVAIESGLSTVYFDVASANLNKTELAKVNQLIDLMNANPTYTLIIKGHADRVGSSELNQELSEERALSVRDYLIKKGIDPLRITTAAYGANFPISTENTPSSRAKNRRVEFEVRN